MTCVIDSIVCLPALCWRCRRGADAGKRRPAVNSVGPPPPSLNGHNRSSPARRCARAAPPPQYTAPARRPAKEPRRRTGRAARRKCHHRRPRRAKRRAARQRRARQDHGAPATARSASGCAPSSPPSNSTAVDRERRARQAIERSMPARNYAPLWIRDGEPTPRAKAAIGRLKGAADEGLDPRRLSGAGVRRPPAPTPLADADLKLTQFRADLCPPYGKSAASRRPAWRSRSTTAITAPEPGDILRKISPTQRHQRHARQLRSAARGFRALKASLPNSRQQRPARRRDSASPTAPPLKLGMPRTRACRNCGERASASARRRADDSVYDKDSSSDGALQHSQAGQRDIKPTGLLDSTTVAAHQRPEAGQQIDTVLANMERWRWLPRDLGNDLRDGQHARLHARVVHDGQRGLAAPRSSPASRRRRRRSSARR